MILKQLYPLRDEGDNFYLDPGTMSGTAPIVCNVRQIHDELQEEK